MTVVVTPPYGWFAIKFYWKRQNLVSSYHASDSEQLWLAMEDRLIQELNINRTH